MLHHASSSGPSISPSPPPAPSLICPIQNPRPTSHYQHASSFIKPHHRHHLQRQSSPNSPATSSQ
eukprot:12890648-Prorocentrum_lima.AAC.1